MTIKSTGPVAFFAAHPVAANLLMILTLMLGLNGMSSLNRQIMPDFDMEMIRITAAWPGASPQDIEENIIEAIEPEVRFLDNIDIVQASAFEGRAELVLIFTEDVDISKALTDVQSSVSRINTFPQEMERPVIVQVSNVDEVCHLEIHGPFSEQTLKVYARKIRDDLLNRGLTKVEIVGGRSSEIWVEVPDSALRELELNLRDVSDRISSASMDMPSGSIESGGRSRQIRSEGLARTPADLAKIEVVSRESGEKVLLNDIATISENFKEGEVSRLHQGRTSIGITITRSKGLDSIFAQQTVAKYLDEIRPTLPPTLQVDLNDVFAEAVTERIDMLLWNGFTGLILVLAALYLFLNGRIAFWVAAGIPISILAALAGMNFMGLTLNMISMFAMIMGLGIIVDDAIVVGERAETLHRRGMDPEEATLMGAQSMFAPVMAASLTTIAAFLPLLMIGSVMGKVVGDLPKTIVLVIVASLVECFLILPMHLRGALIRMDKAGGIKRSRFILAFNEFRDGSFARWVRGAFIQRFSVVTLTICAFFLSLSFMITGRVGFEFFPTPEPNVIFANFSLSPGSPRESTVAMVRELERAAYEAERRLTEGRGEVIFYTVGSIATTAGRQGEAEVGGDHIGSFTVEFYSGEDRNVRNHEFMREWQKEVKPVAGVENLVVLERSVGGPPGKDLDIRLLGGELETLKAAAMDIRAKLRNIPGVESIEDNLPWGKQEILLQLTPAGRAMGFTTERVARQVRGAYEGGIAKRFSRDEEEVIVRVSLPRDVDEQDSIRELYLQTPGGQRVAITEAVDLVPRIGFSTIRRENGVRQVSITADVNNEVSTSNVVLATFTQNFMEEIEAKYGVQIEFKGRAEEQSEATIDVRNAFGIAIATMYLVLAWVFSSYRAPLVVLSIIPFGFIGALIGHWAMGFNLGMFSIFALVGLAGVMVNDSIILVSSIRTLLHEGHSLEQAIVDGTRDRLRPVILTTLTTIGGLTPLLFETSLQARLVQPLAVTLVFGMLLSPLLVLFFVPALLGLGDDFIRRVSGRSGQQGGSGEAPEPVQPTQ
jgi:multidrug efflux pump subunit AcrB